MHFITFGTTFFFSSLANPGPQCDLSNGWRPHGSYCYKLKADTRKSWLEARHDCVVEGGDLVSILSAEEEQFITATLDESHLDLWIGLSTLVRATPGSPTLPPNIGNVLCIDGTFSFFFSPPSQKCNQISCQLQEGNTQFTWSDAQSVGYTNWGPDEPTV